RAPSQGIAREVAPTRRQMRRKQKGFA
ncbi:MAG: hypothetical protein QOG83_3084, partial [Alphaproteobacteria bacterium]|nr:hypothetical protein [Alphaproteobacteria bacterium]